MVNGEHVLKFYESLPFNLKRDLNYFLPENELNYELPGLMSICKSHDYVIDIGCGPALLLNSIARHLANSPTDFLGIDFNPVALSHAQNYAKFYGLKSRFLLKNISNLDERDFPKSGKVFIMSNGVYHHLDEPLKQLQRTLALLDSIAQLSFLFGFYHTPGREVIMTHFRKLKEKGYSVRKLRFEFNQLRRVSEDSLQDESWFQDQVNHPLEHSYGLAEIITVFAKFGFHIKKCSLDKFSGSKESDLLHIEGESHELAKKALKERRFLPGYVSALFVRSIP